MFNILMIVLELYILLLVIKSVLSLVFWANVGSQIKENKLTIEPTNIIINRIKGRGL